MRVFVAIAIALTAWGASVSSVYAEDHYYMVVFGCQNASNKPKYSHTWATFARISQPNSASSAQVQGTTAPEVFTISWLPATMNVVPLRLAPEVGRNYTLEETISWARSVASPVVAFGPVEISKSIFVRARQQYNLLNQGGVSYRALDSGRRETNAINCMHAVSDVAPGPRLVTGTSRGYPGTDLVVNHLRPYFVGALHDPESVAHLMGVDRFGISFRRIEQPIPVQRVEQPISTKFITR